MTTVFSQPGCFRCRQTTATLDRLGKEYQVLNIREDEDAAAQLEALRDEEGKPYMSLPVVLTSGGEHWNGHNPDKLEALA